MLINILNKTVHVTFITVASATAKHCHCITIYILKFQQNENVENLFLNCQTQIFVQLFTLKVNN